MKLLITILFFIPLCLKAQDTTFITNTFNCDSNVTTTIPADTVLVGYHDSTIFDTSYQVYYNYKLYSNVNGNIVVSIPDYTIIPAHDTTFVCEGCGTCYSYDTVITLPPEQMTYGIFPNYTGSFIPVLERIAYAKTYSCNALRDNFDAYYGTLNGKPIKDSGLLWLLTYNTNRVASPTDYFPTGAELTRQLFTLDSNLRTSTVKPDIISFQNEEPNLTYWKGTPQSYITWLNAATDTAHKYGIAVSNGGILQNVIWYIRYVYQLEGKTDSVNYINARTGYGTTTTSFQQAMIDWYKIEIPALAASNIDYVNFHWYEPTSLRTPDNIDNISDLVEIVIRFLGSRTGKPVITTEFGSGNDSQQLFNQLAQQIKDNGVKVMVYYAGDGPLSKLHPDWWKAFILQ